MSAKLFAYHYTGGFTVENTRSGTVLVSGLYLLSSQNKYLHTRTKVHCILRINVVCMNKYKAIVLMSRLIPNSVMK